MAKRKHPVWDISDPEIKIEYIDSMVNGRALQVAGLGWGYGNPVYFDYYRNGDYLVAVTEWQKLCRWWKNEPMGQYKP